MNPKTHREVAESCLEEGITCKHPKGDNPCQECQTSAITKALEEAERQGREEEKCCCCKSILNWNYRKLDGKLPYCGTCVMKLDFNSGVKDRYGTEIKEGDTLVSKRKWLKEDTDYYIDKDGNKRIKHTEQWIASDDLEYGRESKVVFEDGMFKAVSKDYTRPISQMFIEVNHGMNGTYRVDIVQEVKAIEAEIKE